MKSLFQKQRRQQYLLEPYSDQQLLRRTRMREAIGNHLAGEKADVERVSLLSASLADNEFEYLALLYSSGASIERVRSDLASVVECYERYQQALATFEQAPLMSPLGLDQLGDYERAMQIMGLCILLHRPDLLNRMAALIDPGYKGEDTLYEDLLAFYQSGRVELDEWYHDEPYTPLIRAIYEDDKDQAAALLNEYVESWYPAFKYVPWHDGHLRINGTDGDYFGYWAFEAGAVAYLCNIDDSAVTHMVYPKDLVDWARSHAHS